MNPTVLIIEDNENNAYLASFILERHGFNIIKAVDGENGINLALQAKPDLILLDIQLPGMDGYAVASKLAQLETLRQIPVVAVTSYAMPGDRERILAAGCAGYIEKPINPRTFAEEIMRHLPGGKKQELREKSDEKNPDS